jgi:hypothetical protein
MAVAPENTHYTPAGTGRVDRSPNEWPAATDVAMLNQEELSRPLI